jgi:hypothetical protein
LTIAAGQTLQAQSNLQQSLSINSSGAEADPSSLLDVQSDAKGVLVPRMTTAQRSSIASPATGLLVFDTDKGSFWYYGGSAWKEIGGGGSVVPDKITDADGNTRVQTEKNPNEDLIRFEVAGSEVARMDGKTFHLGAPGNSLFIGNNAGKSDDGTDNQNTFAGFEAGQANTTGQGNTAIGHSSLYSNTTGAWNTANGRAVLYSNTTGAENTANGTGALYFNTTGSRNTANGSYALFSNSTGSDNTANGIYALISNTTGHSNVAIGTSALRFNTSRSNLVAVGDSALYKNTTGYGNVAVGSKALYSNTDGYGNTVNGSRALYENTTGSENTANGYRALYSNTWGSENTANGSEALYYNTTGSFNSANGSGALFANTTGEGNSANGSSALYSNKTGSNNTAIGRGALHFVTFSGNTGIGSSTGTDADNSVNCSYIGYDADNDSFANTYSNSTALGASSRLTGSNQVRIGSSSTTSIGGFQNWTNISDGRYKKDVQENVPGLAFIKKLRPVTYHLDTYSLAERLNEDLKDARDNQQSRQATETDLQARAAKAAYIQTGFIAQEVEAAAAAAGFDFSGVDAPQEPNGLYGLRYAEFTVPLVKAVQEMDAQAAKQGEELSVLRAENAALRAEVEVQAGRQKQLEAQLEAQAAQLQQIQAALLRAGLGSGN